MKPRRSVRQWIAGILNIQPHIDEQARHELIETGIRLGVALATEKPASATYKGYGRLVSEQATGAHVQFSAPPPSVASYEQPQKETGPVRQIRGNPLLPMRNVIGPTATESLPAIDEQGRYVNPGGLMRKAERWKQQQRRAGKRTS